MVELVKLVARMLPHSVEWARFDQDAFEVHGLGTKGPENGPNTFDRKEQI